MAVKIRLARLGQKRQPFYRIVVVDSRKKRNGRVIEEIGFYNPTVHPSYIDVKSERALYWLGVGAQPTEQMEAILKLTGDWQKHKGLPAPAEGTLKAPEPKPAFVAPDHGSVIKEQAVAKSAKADAPADAEGAEA